MDRADRARVLLAEDDEDLRAALREELRERGAEVREACDGAELSRRLCEDGPFDLVVSDVRMSWATGAQVLSMARMAGDPTPFLLITGWRDAGLERAAERLGARVLYKPVPAEALAREVERLIGRPPARPVGAARPGRERLDPRGSRVQ